MTLIRGLRQAEERLASLELPSAIDNALTVAVQGLEAAVIETLSHSPGQDHSAPWLRTGALRASIGHAVDGNVAAVGSTSDVATDQELGTTTIPPRPFLSLTAAATADDVAAVIAATLASHLSGR